MDQAHTENLHIISKTQKLEEQLATMRTGMESLQGEFIRLNTSHTSTKQRLVEVSDELQSLASIRKQQQLNSIPGAPFFDPTTQTATACPILQSNGCIVPLKKVINQWFAAATPHDGYMHRTYVCPIMQVHTNLASVAIQERIRQIAQQAGIDTAMPLAFNYQSETGEFIEFEFHDQLGIISKVCAIHAMQLSEHEERAIIHHNTLLIVINAHRTQVKYVCIVEKSETSDTTITKTPTQDGELHIRCFVERLDSRTRFNVNAVIAHNTADHWDPMKENRIRIH